jgi:Ankyrin repeat
MRRPLSMCILMLQIGRTALMYAVANGQASMCRLLLENGADVNERDYNNQLVLDWPTRFRSDAASTHLWCNEGLLLATDYRTARLFRSVRFQL